MSLTRDITVQQGDTVELIIPVLDADNPDADFFGLGGTEVEATIAEAFDASAEPIHTPADGDIRIEPFGDLALDDARFDVSDVPTVDAEFFSIDDDEEVVVVRLPADVTDTFAATVGETGPLVYQVRVIDESDSDAIDTLTTVKGELSVEPRAPFGGA